MWISTPVNTIQADHFASFEIMWIEDSPDDATFSVDGIFAFRDGGVTIFRGTLETCRQFKNVLDLQLINSHITSMDKFFDNGRDAQEANDTVRQVETV